MAAANPEKRREARRLVEEEGLSLLAAARRLGDTSDRNVRRWQQDDERAGDPWQLRSERSAAAKAAADAQTADERAATTARAQRVNRARWADRRSEEADAQGVLAGGMRITSAEALTACRLAIAARDADSAVKWARALRDLAVTGGIHVDKADRLSDLVAAASPTLVLADDDAYRADVAEVLDLVEQINRRAG